VNTIAFGPSSDRVVAGDQAKAVWIFPMPTGEQPRKIDLSAPVYSVDVNRQGTSIAVGSVDQIVILDAATGAIQKRFHQSGSIQAVAFTPDGTALLSAAVKRGRISIHRNPMDAKALADEVCHVLTHNLSPEQWRTLIGPEPRRRTCPNLP
jgi:WD40 repeat protein